MAIKDTLTNDMKDALKRGRKVELGALRLALAAIRKQEIDARRALDDGEATNVLAKLVKQGREAQAHFAAAGRGEQAGKEAVEIAVLERYLPQKLDPAETELLIRRAIEATGASGIKDMGRVMERIRAEASGNVDMALASARTREILAGS